MKSPVQLSRDEMIGQFWTDVRIRLKAVYKRTNDKIDLGIGRYRHDTEQRSLGDTVYNQGVERTAEIVEGVIENGLPVDSRR